MAKLVQATIAAFLTIMILSFVFYELLMKEQFAVWEAAVARPEPVLWSGVLAFLLLSLLMAWLFPKGYEGGEPWQEGARLGAIVGAVIACCALVMFSVFELQLAGSLTDMVFNFALFSLAGAVVGLVHGRIGAA
jgi:hypothetical protein